jgi:hypothetical protein
VLDAIAVGSKMIKQEIKGGKRRMLTRMRRRGEFMVVEPVCGGWGVAGETHTHVRGETRTHVKSKLERSKMIEQVKVEEMQR